MSDFRLTERQVRDYVGSRSFGLGEEYYESGAIFDARREGAKLTAACRGSYRSAYKVRATLGTKGVTGATCTCPVGSGECKHVAALLLAFVREPELFAEAEKTQAQLATKSKEELLALIQQMLRRRPELESLMQTMPEPGKPRDPLRYERQADEVFSNSTGDWDDAAQIAEELETILDETDELIQGRNWLDASAVYQGVLDSLISNAGSTEDDEGSLAGVMLDCVEGLTECLPKIEDAQRRMSILESLMDAVLLDDQLGGFGFGDEAYHAVKQHATRPEQRALVDLLRTSGADEALVSEMEEGLLSDDEFIQQCRETGRYDALIERLLKLKRVEEATSTALRAHEALLPRLADLFVQAGYAQAAEQWMRQRAHRTTRPELLRWLRERCLARRDHQAALEYARREYQARPTLEAYEQVRRLAKRLNQWDAIRGDALRLLASRAEQKAPAVKALVTEGMVEEAVSILRTERLDDLSVWLAKSVEKCRPDVSIELYASEADRLISLRSRPNYRAACHLLSRARKLCAADEAQELWQARIAAVRKRCSGLPALLEEMHSAKLI